MITTKVLRHLSAAASALIACLASGCFWVSSPPDFKADPVVEIVVFWDTQVSSNLIESETWATTNASLIKMIVKPINLRSWESSTLLLTAHPTRMILVTGHGQKWELHCLDSDPGSVSMFDLNNPGRSGSVLGGGEFVAQLTSAMRRELLRDVDLRANLKGVVSSEGKITRRVPAATQKQLDRFRPATKPQSTAK